MDQKPLGKEFDDTGVEYRYLPDIELVMLIRSLPWSMKDLVSIKGKMRWVIQDKDGARYILRPESAKPKDE